MTSETTQETPRDVAFAEDEYETKKKTITVKRLIAASVIVIVIVAGLVYWFQARRYETTDDAQVDGHFAQLSSRVNGTVTYVNPQVENDKYVRAGTLLLELDPRDYEVELERAKANLETKQAQARSALLQVPITGAAAYSQLHQAEAAQQQAIESVASAKAELAAARHRVEQDEAVASRTERDRVRYAALVEKREISRSYYDARATDAATSAQTLASDRAASIAAERKVDEMQSLVVQRQAQVMGAHTAPQQTMDAQALAESAQGALDQARADVHTAELNLSYTKIYAPVSGVVGHKTVELGHRVQPGQSLLTVVPTDDIWITANFKETQLRHMHPGQSVTVHVDTFGRDYQGTVEDMAGASGPLFSLFPPENASGNYVKIVQRFPIRIRINNDQDTQHLLRPGMSVEATTSVR
jgi:membrane fusion protein (multidrug efflux system)